MKEQIQQEMTRLEELLKMYEEIGSAGFFGVGMIKGALIKAKKSIEENNERMWPIILDDLKKITG